MKDLGVIFNTTMDFNHVFCCLYFNPASFKIPFGSRFCVLITILLLWNYNMPSGRQSCSAPRISSTTCRKLVLCLYNCRPWHRKIHTYLLHHMEMKPFSLLPALPDVFSLFVFAASVACDPQPCALWTIPLSMTRSQHSIFLLSMQHNRENPSCRACGHHL